MTMALVPATAGTTALTVVLLGAIVFGWVVLGAIYFVFFRRRGS